MPNEPGTLVWTIRDINGEAIGELIVAWSARSGDQEDPDWTRQLTGWRIAPFLPGDFALVKQQIDADKQVDGATPYERSAQANEIWNDYLMSEAVQPGTTAAEFRGNIGPIPNFQL